MRLDDLADAHCATLAYGDGKRAELALALTGERRPISNNLKDLAELTLRDDIPDTDWAWGFDLSYSF